MFCYPGYWSTRQLLNFVRCLLPAERGLSIFLLGVLTSLEEEQSSKLTSLVGTFRHLDQVEQPHAYLIAVCFVACVTGGVDDLCGGALAFAQGRSRSQSFVFYYFDHR